MDPELDTDLEVDIDPKVCTDLEACISLEVDIDPKACIDLEVAPQAINYYFEVARQTINYYLEDQGLEYFHTSYKFFLHL